MVKKTTKKAQVVRPRLSRPNAGPSAPTPVVPALTTPSSSAFPSAVPSAVPSAIPSAYASEDEDDGPPAKFDARTIPMAKLTLENASPEAGAENQNANGEFKDAAAANGETSENGETDADGKGKEPEESIVPFRFLDLPSELRVKIYGYHFESTDPVTDLTPDNYRKVFRKLLLLRTCRTVYQEASYYFYSSHIFRIFPTHPGRFFKTRRPLLARLNKGQRSAMTRLELRLGPGFNKPPKCWVVQRKLGLKECVNVRTVNVFVQLDPSVSWLDGFRKAGFYETFSSSLLNDILTELPNVDTIEFDGYESVRKNCPIMEALQQTVREHKLRVTWGPKNGWTETSDNATNVKLNNGAGTGKVIINIGPNAEGMIGPGPIITYDSPIMSVA
ncbi:hypothetical protein SEUCBS139899_005608 [Sporothrix eucalyptigena]|uniref:F-box domain containing protein n=1 Tax=Sporothrix eucalyptigena TaxID=1812306 RepID=A0ABP0C168_9PEZI